MGSNGDNIDSGETAPFSVSHTVITKLNVMENQLDGCLLFTWNNTGIKLYVSIHVLSCYRAFVIIAISRLERV